MNMTDDDASDVITISIAARILGVSRQRVHQLVREGRLAGTWTGSNWVLSRSAVTAYNAQIKGRGGPGRRVTTDAPQPVRRRKPPQEPADAIAEVLAQPRIAEQLERARMALSDPQARHYVGSTMRALWETAMRPEELAQLRSAGPRTLTRLRAVFRALHDADLLADTGDDRSVVNHGFLAGLSKSSE